MPLPTTVITQTQQALERLLGEKWPQLGWWWLSNAGLRQHAYYWPSDAEVQQRLTEYQQLPWYQRWYWHCFRYPIARYQQLLACEALKGALGTLSTDDPSAIQSLETQIDACLAALSIWRSGLRQRLLALKRQLSSLPTDKQAPQTQGDKTMNSGASDGTRVMHGETAAPSAPASDTHLGGRCQRVYQGAVSGLKSVGTSLVGGASRLRSGFNALSAAVTGTAESDVAAAMAAERPVTVTELGELLQQQLGLTELDLSPLALTPSTVSQPLTARGLLGIGADVELTEDLIKRQYRLRVRRYHPDTTQNLFGKACSDNKAWSDLLTYLRLRLEAARDALLIEVAGQALPSSWPYWSFDAKLIMYLVNLDDDLAYRAIRWEWLCRFEDSTHDVLRERLQSQLLIQSSEEQRWQASTEIDTARAEAGAAWQEHLRQWDELLERYRELNEGAEERIQANEAAIQAHEASIKRSQESIRRHEASIRRHEASIRRHEASIRRHEVSIRRHEASTRQHEMNICQLERDTSKIEAETKAVETSNAHLAVENLASAARAPAMLIEFLQANGQLPPDFDATSSHPQTLAAAAVHASPTQASADADAAAGLAPSAAEVEAESDDSADRAANWPALEAFD